MVIDISDLETCNIETLRNESLEEGYNMVNRLVAEYRSGENRFDKPGEKFTGYILDNEIVAVCGLNIEPTDNRLGRIRRLYVMKEHRHLHIGTELIKHLSEYAREYFSGVVVNIGELLVENFYISAGFSPVNNASYSHIYRFTK